MSASGRGNRRARGNGRVTPKGTRPRGIAPTRAGEHGRSGPDHPSHPRTTDPRRPAPPPPRRRTGVRGGR